VALAISLNEDKAVENHFDMMLNERVSQIGQYLALRTLCDLRRNEQSSCPYDFVMSVKLNLWSEEVESVIRSRFIDDSER
jgi:hypothetical protein